MPAADGELFAAAARQMLTKMTRRAEVVAYAEARNVDVGDAIIELVNSELSGTYTDGWCDGWHAGVADVRQAIKSLPTPSVDQPSKRGKGKRHGN